jgi:hypothetical protein
MSKSVRRNSNLPRAVNKTTIPKYSKYIKLCPELQDLCMDLLVKHIEGKFYAEELSHVIVRKKTVHQIDKILRKRFRNGSMEFLVRWAGYSSDFDSWISAKAVKIHGVLQ